MDLWIGLREDVSIGNGPADERAARTGEVCDAIADVLGAWPTDVTPREDIDGQAVHVRGLPTDHVNEVTLDEIQLIEAGLRASIGPIDHVGILDR